MKAKPELTRNISHVTLKETKLDIIDNIQLISIFKQYEIL